MKPQVNPSTSKPRRTKIWLLAYTVVALVIVGWLLAAARQPLRADVRFTGYTNNAAGTRLASFEVVNRSAYTIRSLPYHFAAVPPGGKSIVLPAYKGQGVSLLLPEAHETVFVVPPPTTNAWQVKLSYTEKESPPVQIFRGLVRLLGVRQSGKVQMVEGPVVAAE